MSRYIDADAFAEKMKRQYCERCDKYQGLRCNRCSCGDWLDALDFVPTADVVEVVRCKDCKYLDKGENDSESWCECTAHFGKYFAVDENGFCSYGERAEK